MGKKSWALVVTPLILVTMMLWDESTIAWLMPGSKLGAFEDRIKGPAYELMRRSPELRRNFEDFQKCEATSGCNTARIFAKRDTIIRKAWPEVYPRLNVRQDWSMCTSTYDRCEDTDLQHDAFEATRARVGEVKLQYECVPVIQYRTDSRATFDTYGYQCKGITK